MKKTSNKCNLSGSQKNNCKNETFERKYENMAHLVRPYPKTRKARPIRGPVRDFSPIKWDQYFDSAKDVDVDGNSFRVYISGSAGPVLVLLHGGGYSGLTWALFTKEILSRINCKILALDLRGHGETHTCEDENLSLEYMTSDILSVIQKMCTEDEHIIFIGHSMGGAIAVHCAQKLQNAATLCVIDVVEGTALESLASMQSFLRGRPTSFSSVENAIQWCFKNGQTHNLESAKVSMPGQIKNMISGKLAASETHEPAEVTNESGSTSTASPVSVQDTVAFKSPMVPTINEDGSEDNEAKNAEEPSIAAYTWRINLSKTEVYWRDWFKGLSQEFLNVSIPKLLLLANIHGLDTTLTVGQMQGKFQMQVLPRCGHAIHEDLPDKVADIIATFLIRHRLATALGDYSPMFPSC